MSAIDILFVASMLGALGYVCYTAVSVIRLIHLKQDNKEMNEVEAKARKSQADMNRMLDEATKRQSQAKDHPQNPS